MLKRFPLMNLRAPRWPELPLSRISVPGRRRVVLGAALIGAGLLALVSQFADPRLFGLLFLPILGLSLLIWGIGAHHEGLLVSGSVVSGLGVGVLLIEHALAPLSAEARGGVFLLAVAGGWAAIPLFTALLRLGLRWWPLLTAAILALVGLALLLGGALAATLVLIGQLWPAALVVAGLVVLLRGERRPALAAADTEEASARPELEITPVHSAHADVPAHTHRPSGDADDTPIPA